MEEIVVAAIVVVGALALWLAGFSAHFLSKMFVLRGLYTLDLVIISGFWHASKLYWDIAFWGLFDLANGSTFLSGHFSEI